MSTPNCYVYMYVIDGVPRYVGKGINGRDMSHLKHAQSINAKRAAGERVRSNRWRNHLAKALREERSINVVRVAEGLTDEQAWENEIELIALHGRSGIDSGTLINELTGGEGFTSADMKRIFADPLYRANLAASIRKRYADPVYRANNKATNQKNAADPVWRAKNKAVGEKNAASPEWHAKLKAGNQKRLANPKWRAKNKAVGEKNAASREWHAKLKTTMQKITADPVWKANHKTAMQKRAADPEWRAKLKVTMQRIKTDPKHLAKLKDPKYREKLSIGIRAGKELRRQKNAILGIVDYQWIRGRRLSDETRAAMRAACARRREIRELLS